MPIIDVKIVRRGDKPPWEGMAKHREPRHHLDNETWYVAGLEGGMASGAPSIALFLDLPDGGAVIAETSLAAWIAATCALRGAYPDAFADTPLADEQDETP